MVLELDDIQHFLLTRTPALAARYEFLSFRSPAGGKAWLAALRKTVQSAATVRSSAGADDRWVSVAFTWNGLRALGVDEASLATFPEEFRQGMAPRAAILGDTGANHPDHWVGDLAGPDLHAIVILFARDVAERERCRAEHEELVAQCEGVEVLSTLDLEAVPPFGVRPRPFRLSRPAVPAGHRRERRGADTGFGRTAEAGRVHPGLPGRGRAAGPPAPAGDPVAQRQLHGLPPAGGARGPVPRLPAPRTVRRRRNRSWWPPSSWAAGAVAHRWCWRPRPTIPALGADMQRNNDFNYKQMDPHGYAVPLGSHIRRMNPRDTAVNMNRRRMIRRGATYGPPLPEDKPPTTGWSAASPPS